MKTTALTSTSKGQLPKAQRLVIPIRLLAEDHSELKRIADNEQRSMSFIAMRRYLKGRELELNKQNQ